MPIYEYQCAKCGEFEVSQRITEDSLKRCPTCRGKVKKLISNTSFQLKGSGWYQTDYGSKKGASDKPAKGGETAGAESSTTESSSSESSSSDSGSTDKAIKPPSKGKSKPKADASAKAA